MKKNVTLACLIMFIFAFLASCGKKATEPEPTPEQEVVLSNKAKKLDESTIGSMVSVDTSGTVTFSQNTQDLQSLKPGDIIASKPTTAAPYGFLKEVERVSVSGTSVIVTTSQATLEDVFQKASISILDTLTMDDLDIEKSILPKSVSLRKGAGIGIHVDIDTLYDIDGNPGTTNDQIRANGSFEINTVFQLIVKLDNFSLKELKFTNMTTESIALEITASSGLSARPIIRLAEFSFKPITIMVAGWPVVIHPVLGVDLGANIDADLEFRTGATQTAEFEAGIEFKNGQWSPIAEFTNSYTYSPPELATSLSARGYVGPSLSLLLYGLAGPYANLLGYLELLADISQSPWWQLYIGAGVGVGVDINLFGRDIADYYLPDVISYRKVIAEASGGPPDIVPPAPIADLAAINPTAGSITLTWTASGDDGYSGTASQYDIRYSTSSINESNWAIAIQCVGEPSPKAAGSSESFTVSGLSPNSLYHFGMKTADEIPNWSTLSNIAVARTESEAPGGFVRIPAGTFMMGSPLDEAERSNDETQHLVTLTRPFYISTREVTNQQFAELANWAISNRHAYVASSYDGNGNVWFHIVHILPYSVYAYIFMLTDSDLYNTGYSYNAVIHVVAGREDYPIKGVSWLGAASYCDWLNLREGLPYSYNYYLQECWDNDPYGRLGYRLPTEAEWEYACRAGTQTAFNTGNCLHSGTEANYNGSYPYTGCPSGTYVDGVVPVGSYPANSFGLYDMHGNVLEWCNDKYGGYSGDITDPLGNTAGYRVLRGGSWYDYASHCRSASRAYYGSNAYIGIRPVRSAN